MADATEAVPRRRDKCANHLGWCDNWCEPGEFFCSGHCRAACDERDAEKHIGGSLERWACELDLNDLESPPTRQVNST